MLYLSLSVHLDSCQVNNFDRKWIWYLKFVFSAPRESLPPPLRNLHGAVPDIRRNVVKTWAIVSGLESNVTSTHTMVSDIHRTMVKCQEGGDDKDLVVSDTWAVPITKYMLTLSQPQTRSASPVRSRSNILYLCLVDLVNHLPLPQGPVLDVTN